MNWQGKLVTGWLKPGEYVHVWTEDARGNKEPVWSTEVYNVRCYDNGDNGADRYTVVYLDFPIDGKPGHFQGIGCNERPFHPQGIGQHCEVFDGLHLGKRVELWTLPADVQKLVKQDLDGKE